MRDQRSGGIVGSSRLAMVCSSLDKGVNDLRQRNVNAPRVLFQVGDCCVYRPFPSVPVGLNRSELWRLDTDLCLGTSPVEYFVKSLKFICQYR